ncbi:MAG: hypothetical protein K1X79_05095 [Oligoflexia bacterium]|nr:hypothetical protein [Oligoflexia bacterium]
MNSTFDNAQRFLKEYTSQRWPGITLNTELRPLADLSLGDVTSSVPIQAARLLRLRADDCAKEIVAAWPPVGHGMPRQDGDYLNISIIKGWDDYSVQVPSMASPAGRKLSVFVPPLVGTAGLGAQVRLLARIAIQIRLLQSFGKSFQVQIGGSEELPITGSALGSIFSELLTHSLTTRLTGCFDVANAIKAAIDSDYSSKHIIWLLPALLDPNRLRAFLPRGESAGLCELCFASKRWSEWSVDEEQARELLSWGASDLQALVWYLAQESGAADLDLFIPRSQEKANIVWRIVRAFERAERLQASLCSGEDTPFNEEHRYILHRLWFIPHFMQAAAENGQVPEFISALTQLVDCFNALCNQPQFRLRLERGQIGCGEGKILTGVLHLLSGIIRESGLF